MYAVRVDGLLFDTATAKVVVCSLTTRFRLILMFILMVHLISALRRSSWSVLMMEMAKREERKKAEMQVAAVIRGASVLHNACRHADLSHLLLALENGVFLWDFECYHDILFSCHSFALMHCVFFVSPTERESLSVLMGQVVPSCVAVLALAHYAISRFLTLFYTLVNQMSCFFAHGHCNIGNAAFSTAHLDAHPCSGQCPPTAL